MNKTLDKLEAVRNWIIEHKKQLIHATKVEGFTFETGYVDSIGRLQNMEDDISKNIEKEKANMEGDNR